MLRNTESKIGEFEKGRLKAGKTVINQWAAACNQIIIISFDGSELF